MKILVCIKQVAEIDNLPGLNHDSTWIDESESASYRMNRYDEQALEQALLMKDKDSSINIDALTVGPDRASSVVKRALEKGASGAYHIVYDNPHLTAFESSSLIADFARDRNYNLILTGVMSEDLMQFAVGPMTASKLKIPCGVAAVNISLGEQNYIEIDSEIEGGYTEKISISMPCLITVQTGTARPRYPSLTNKLRAKDILVVRTEIDLLDLSIPAETFIEIMEPSASVKGIVLQGDISEKAAMLAAILHERSLL